MALKCLPLGTQILFEHNLEMWRHSIGFPLDGSIENSAYNSPTPPLPPPLPQLPPQLPPPLPTLPLVQQLSPSSPGTSSSLRYLPYPRTADKVTSDTVPEISLITILKDTEKGKLILEAFKKVSCLKQNQRLILINTIAKYFEAHNINLSLANSYKLEKEIVELFPSEKMVCFGNNFWNF